jgi:hypothetical protein
MFTRYSTACLTMFPTDIPCQFFIGRIIAVDKSPIDFLNFLALLCYRHTLQYRPKHEVP